jgi:hypothetical protein
MQTTEIAYMAAIMLQRLWYLDHNFGFGFYAMVQKLVFTPCPTSDNGFDRTIGSVGQLLLSDDPRAADRTANSGTFRHPVQKSSKDSRSKLTIRSNY